MKWITSFWYSPQHNALRQFWRSKGLYGLIGYLLLTGCMMGPQYQSPTPNSPDHWTALTSQESSTYSQITIQTQWWRQLNEPMLENLLNQAVRDNFDLKIAESRIIQARAARLEALSGLLPTFDILGSGIRQRNQLAFPGAPELTKPFNTFQTGFDASWELDLFGAQRYQIAADSATLDAMKAAHESVVISLVGEIVRTYVDIRLNQEVLLLSQQEVEIGAHQVDILSHQNNVGLVATTPVAKAKAQLSTIETQVAQAQTQLTHSEYQMDLLLGASPGTTHALMSERGSIPVFNDRLLLMAPARVIANRPDIHMAERQLAAATAQQGVATAAFFPDVSLAGFLGLLSLHGNQLIQASSYSWETSGSVIWKILNFGKLSAHLDLTKAQQQEALIHYQQVVAAALIEVEKSLTTYQQQLKILASLQEAVNEHRHLYRIAAHHYERGSENLLEVLSAQSDLRMAERQYLEAQAALTQDMVAVYKSLGGGWKASAH